jgi:tricorn protease interacting factor F2/3
MPEVNPINYGIHLEPDLKSFTVLGRTQILCEAIEPVDTMILNTLDLAIRRCSVEVDDRFVDCLFYPEPEKEEIRVCLPKKTGGRIKLQIDYMGHINNKMAGFYRTKYVTGGQAKYAAVTQFQESDARRAFPCFDHPLKKATFDIEILIDKELTAISNGPIIEEKPLGDGKKLIRFQQTPKMSTYLVFLGVGPFEFLEDPTQGQVRVATMPGMTKFAQLGLTFGRKSLEYCEDYYGMKYPLPKLDLIAIEDFAAGAMENWGAMTFRENLLLYYPNITSRVGEQRICEVIAHETAHQWFGNLVTPSDWKYLWLNESFATYFGYGVVDYYYPEWDVWGQFLNGQTDSALHRDALHETFSIEIPGGEHVVINASTAPIIYNKGASILRQVLGYIGENNFREGVRHHLRRHAYACASSQDLWEAFEEVSDTPVTNMMKSWVEEPGHPTVDVRRDGNRLILTQKRFTYLPNASDQQWLVPVIVKIRYHDGNSKTIKTLLESKSGTIDVGDDPLWYKVNYGQTGFYRVKYHEKENHDGLGKAVLSKELPAADRWGLQGDLYAQVRSGDACLDDYLDFLSYYSDEHSFLPLAGMVGNLFHAFFVMGGDKKEKVSSIGRSFVERVLSRIGYEPNADEKHTTSILRDQIIWHGVLYDSKNITEFAVAKFSLLLRGQTIHPDIARSVMQAGAFKGNDEVFTWLEGKLQSSESEHERMNLLTALGSFGRRALIEKAQRYALNKVPDRNRFVPLCAMAANPQAVSTMWEWFVSHLDDLEQFHAIHFQRVLGAIVPVAGMGKEEQVRSFSANYVRKKGAPKEVIKLCLEKLEINLQMRAA